jgi:hypothetical protein
MGTMRTIKTVAAKAAITATLVAGLVGAGAGTASAACTSAGCHKSAVPPVGPVKTCYTVSYLGPLPWKVVCIGNAWQRYVRW